MDSSPSIQNNNSAATQKTPRPTKRNPTSKPQQPKPAEQISNEKKNVGQRRPVANPSFRRQYYAMPMYYAAPPPEYAYQYRPQQRQEYEQYFYRRREVSIGEEKRLDSKILPVPPKEFQIDVLENKLGKYLKLVEVSSKMRRPRILMTFSVAAELRERLEDFQRILDQQPPWSPPQPSAASPPTPQTNSSPRSGFEPLRNEKRLKSESIVRENRRYYLDLKENNIGRFLRLTLTSLTSRSVVVIPADGLVPLRRLLDEFAAKFVEGESASSSAAVASPGDPSGSQTSADGARTATTGTVTSGADSVSRNALLESKSLRVGRGTMYYFDVGIDRRGAHYLRVSDVRPTYRTAISVPCHAWGEFRDALTSYVDKLNTLDGKVSSPGGKVSPKDLPIVEE